MIDARQILDNAVEKFQFGSRVYGTQSEESDWDFIVVLPEGDIKPQTFFDDGNCHYILYEYDEFITKIKNHDISALESIFSRFHEDSPFHKYFEYNEHKLRESISTISNNSWVKGKKKLIISGDYDKKAGLKSIFHSIRIVRYGIQIARNKRITDFGEINWLWFELEKLGQQYDSDILWEKVDTKYRSLYKATQSEFKQLAKKDLVVRDLSKQLKDILIKNNCYTFEMHKEIWDVFNET